MVLLTSGCGVIRANDFDPPDDPALTDQFSDLRESGGSRLLAEIAPGDWDTFHLFGEYSSWADVAAATGQETRYSGPLDSRGVLIFMRGPDVVRASRLTSPQIYDTGTFDRTVIVDAGEPGGGPPDLTIPPG